VVADRSARHEEAPFGKASARDSSHKAMALIAAGSRYITNFDADPAHEAA